MSTPQGDDSKPTGVRSTDDRNSEIPEPSFDSCHSSLEDADELSCSSSMATAPDGFVELRPSILSAPIPEDKSVHFSERNGKVSVLSKPNAIEGKTNSGNSSPHLGSCSASPRKEKKSWISKLLSRASSPTCFSPFDVNFEYPEDTYTEQGKTPTRSVSEPVVSLPETRTELERPDAASFIPLSTFLSNNRESTKTAAVHGGRNDDISKGSEFLPLSTVSENEKAVQLLVAGRVMSEGKDKRRNEIEPKKKKMSLRKVFLSCGMSGSHVQGKASLDFAESLDGQIFDLAAQTEQKMAQKRQEAVGGDDRKPFPEGSSEVQEDSVHAVVTSEIASLPEMDTKGRTFHKVGIGKGKSEPRKPVPLLEGEGSADSVATFVTARGRSLYQSSSVSVLGRGRLRESLEDTASSAVPVSKALNFSPDARGVAARQEAGDLELAEGSARFLLDGCGDGSDWERGSGPQKQKQQQSEFGDTSEGGQKSAEGHSRMGDYKKDRHIQLSFFEHMTQQEISRRVRPNAEDVESMGSFLSEGESEAFTETTEAEIGPGADSTAHADLDQRLATLKSRPPSHSQFLRGHSRRIVKLPDIPSAFNKVRSKYKQEKHNRRAHALRWEHEHDPPHSDFASLRLLFVEEQGIRRDKLRLLEGSLAFLDSPASTPSQAGSQKFSVEMDSQDILAMYRDSSPQLTPRSPLRRPESPGRSLERKQSLERSVAGLESAVVELSLQKVLEQATREMKEKEPVSLRRVMSEGAMASVARGMASIASIAGEGQRREQGKAAAAAAAAAAGEDRVGQPMTLLQFGKDTEDMLQKEEEEVVEEKDDEEEAEAEEEAGAVAEEEKVCPEPAQEQEQEQAQEQSSSRQEATMAAAAQEACQLGSGAPEISLTVSRTMSDSDGMSLHSLGLSSRKLLQSSSFAPGRLFHREYGPIAVARSRVLGCREHWSWLIVEFLEDILRGYTGNLVPAGSPHSPLRIPASSSRLGGASWRQVATPAAARRDFDMLQRKFLGLESNLNGLPPGALSSVYTSGLACWLKYWDMYADVAVQEDFFLRADSEEDPAAMRRAHSSSSSLSDVVLGAQESVEGSADGLRGLRRSADSAGLVFLQDLLLGEVLDRQEWVDEGEVAGSSPLDVLRVVGLAAGVAHSRPATAVVVLVRLLERIGRGLGRQLKPDAQAQAGEEGAVSYDVWVLEACQFVVACLLALLSACQLPKDAVDSSLLPAAWQPPRLTLLAELALAEAICGAAEASRAARLAEVDRLYRGGVGLSPGLGLLAFVLVAELRALGGVPARVLVDLAVSLVQLGCPEAGFAAALQAVGSGGAEAEDLDDVLLLTLLAGPFFRPFSARFTSLLGAVRRGALQQGTAYVADFADAMLRSAEGGVSSAERQWAFEVTLSFLRLNVPKEQSDQGSRERDLWARIVLARWMKEAALRVAQQEGSSAPDSQARCLHSVAQFVAALEDPEAEVGWPVWVRIGQVVGHWEGDTSALQLEICKKAVLWNYEKLLEDGTLPSDPPSLTAFDWALDCLLLQLPDQQSGSEAGPRGSPAESLLFGLLAPLHEEEVVDVALTVAERMAGRTFSRWALLHETAQFVAQLLCIADSRGMDEAQFQRAVQVGLRLWGWVLPKPQQLAAECETEVEAREVLERAMVALWQSVAEKGMSEE